MMIKTIEMHTLVCELYAVCVSQQLFAEKQMKVKRIAVEFQCSLGVRGERFQWGADCASWEDRDKFYFILAITGLRFLPLELEDT